MKTGSQMAVAIGAGYLLGRRRKMRLAMMASAAALAGGAEGIGGRVLRKGAKLAGARLASTDLLGKVSPELGELGGILRNDLLDAGKGAARSAVNSRVDSLSDKLHDRAEAWRNPAQGGLPGGREEEQPEEEEAEEEPAAPARASRGSRQRSAANGEGERDRPARRSARTGRSAGTAAPVRRARR